MNGEAVQLISGHVEAHGRMSPEEQANFSTLIKGDKQLTHFFRTSYAFSFNKAANRAIINQSVVL